MEQTSLAALLSAVVTAQDYWGCTLQVLYSRSLDSVLVPILPTSLHHEALCCPQCWSSSQRCKLSMPSMQEVSTVKIAISTVSTAGEHSSWMPMANDSWYSWSANFFCYLLVIQDYYTKWAEAIPIPDQKEVTITNELIKVLSGLGIPEIYTLIKDVILKALFWLKPWMHLALASPVQPPTTSNVMGW